MVASLHHEDFRIGIALDTLSLFMAGNIWKDYHEILKLCLAMEF
jgi:hypothetical protein